MRRFLAATDFSARSAPALRRAAQLSAALGAELVLVHVLDEDMPRGLMDSHAENAEALLREEAGQIGAKWRIETGDVFAGVLAAAEAEEAALIILGAPRRGGLRTLFAGTTAERIIRNARVPVLMAMGDTALSYKKIMLASDFSDGATRAAEALQDLGLAEAGGLAVLNVFETPALLALTQSQTTKSEIERYILEQRAEASGHLEAFLGTSGLGQAEKLLKLAQASAARVICATAKETGADLIVMGTRGQSGLKRFILGSVTEEVLRLTDIDVLAVPPGQGAD